MTRKSFNLSAFILSILATLAPISATAEETSTTQINPITEESTTTTVNSDTQQTTIVKENPTTGETTTTIFTPTPAPQEIVPIPTGYVNCFTVSAGWNKDIWVPEHRVCQYDQTNGAHEGMAWVDGHWTCTKYKASEGLCIKWEWKAGHWVKTFNVY